jgi:hypothetical protein
MPMKEYNLNQQYQYMTRRIGSTTYKVKVVFGEGGETMEEKILRMIQNDSSASDSKYGIIKTPQMSRQSERSA